MWGGSRRDEERRWSLLSWLTDDGRAEQSSDQRGLFGWLRDAVTVVAFWLAIPLPFLYVPVLFSGLETQSEFLLFGALLVAHVAALSLGYPHATEKTDDTDRSRSANRSRGADRTPGD